MPALLPFVLFRYLVLATTPHLPTLQNTILQGNAKEKIEGGSVISYCGRFKERIASHTALPKVVYIFTAVPLHTLCKD